MGAILKPEHKFIFAVPEDFISVKNKFNWPSVENISFHFISKIEIDELNKNFLFCSIKKSLLVKKIINRYKVTHVFLLMLMEFIPALPFVLPKSIRVSGIIYLIYLYRWKKSSLITKLVDVFKYLLFSRFKIFEKVYLLNDEIASIYLNRLYSNNKYYYLPDPFVPILSSNKDIRGELSIGSNKTLLIHFGALNYRKGTIDILEAIELLHAAQLENMCFVFAGRVSEEIKTEFYQMLEILQNKVQLIVFDQFCGYSFLGDLCKAADYILIPYKNTLQSSGLIGYAAQFGIPVIGPAENLLGKLIKKHHLGYTIKNLDSAKLSHFIIDLPKAKFSVNSDYNNAHSVDQFCHIVL